MNKMVNIRLSIKLVRLLMLSGVMLLLSGCKIQYSFTGASIGPEVETVFVDFFNNRAKLVNPTLSQIFTESLKDKFANELGLTLTNGEGHLEFSGSITQYYTKPLAIQQSDDGMDFASQNRFTIGVKVKFVNNTNHEQDFDSSFSAFYDYDSTISFNDVETVAVEEITTQLLEDIFNKSVATW